MTILFAERKPSFVKLTNGSVVEVELSARVEGESRGFKTTMILQLSYIGVGTTLTGEAITSFDPTKITLFAPADDAAQNALYMIEGVKSPTLIVPLDIFLSFLSEQIVDRLRATQTSNILYRKAKVRLHLDPPSAIVNNRARRSSLRTYANYSFTFISGTTGQLEAENLRVGAISFSLYPLTKLEGNAKPETVPDSSVIDRPSRFLVRGSGISPKEVFSVQTLKSLETLFTSVLPLVPGDNWVFFPVVDVGGDIVRIRAAQNMGYVRVAGQKGRKPGILASEDGGQI